MKTLLHNLSKAWLILALIAAPVQVATADSDDFEQAEKCLMTPNDPIHAGHGVATNAASDENATDCTACLDHNCASDQCNSDSCLSLHLQLSPPNTIRSYVQSLTVKANPTRLDWPESTTPSLLLRPPLV